MHPYKGHVYVILLVYLIISLESSIEKFFIISAWNLYNYYCLNIVVSFEKKDAHLLYARRCRLDSRVRVLIIACIIDIIYIYTYICRQRTVIFTVLVRVIVYVPAEMTARMTSFG